MTNLTREHSAPTATARGGRGATSVRVGTAWLLASTVTVSGLNYAYTVSLMWWLPTASYAVAASAAALLLICGTVATASAPWVLAQEVAAGRDDAERRRTAVSFAIAANLMQGVLSAMVAYAVAARYADGPTLGALTAAIIVIFAAATSIGYLQGLERFRLIAALRLAEVVVKIASGAVLIGLGAGAGGVLAGYAIGAGVVAVIGVVVMAPDLRLQLSAVRNATLWARARGVLLIQVGVAVLVSADVVVGSVSITRATTLATYQVSLIIARVPVVLAGALSIAAFSRLSTLRHAGDLAAQLRACCTMFVQISVPIAVAVATLPSAVTGRIFAPAYQGGVGALLPWTAAAGVLLGAVNLLTTPFQAQARFRRPIRLLGLGLLGYAPALVAGVALGGATGLAIGSVLGSALVVVLLVRATCAEWPGSVRGVLPVLLLHLATAAPLVLLRGHLLLWLAWLVIGVAAPMVRAIVGRKPMSSNRTDARPRILHLAYEDPRRPGAGGGSVRTHEINRRLADRWDITAVCAPYPGCEERVEDGVHYVHLGRQWGHALSLLTYFASLPLALRRYPSELVVEEFAAPFGSLGVPAMTRRPVIGVVQWLFADSMRTKYHLPFPVVEQLGLRTHRRLIGVSADLCTELRERNARAEVTTVRNGLDERAFDHRSRSRADAVYLGRLDVPHKGLDLLLDAFAIIADDVVGDLLLAGDGPDEPFLRARVHELGLGSRVHFLGRVSAADRFDLLAGAQLVVMPSRFETFGMVAAEALAVGTPVLCFEIACLSELTSSGCGVQVPAYDVAAYAAAMAGLMRDAGRCAELGRSGPAAVSGLRWDEIALQQEDVYRSALAERPAPMLAAAR